MPKQLMGNLDYFFLCRELRELAGSRLDNAYDYPGGFRLKFRKSSSQFSLVVELGARIHLSNLIPESPREPTGFAKLLRKELENAVLEKIEQINFDRVLELCFSRGRKLVFEQLGKGNCLLLDADNKIIRPMRGEEFSSRKLRTREKYSPPPSSKKHPLEITAGELKLGQANAVAAFSKQVNLAPSYLEEALARAGYGKGAGGAEVDSGKVLGKIAEMLEEKPEPVVYFDENNLAVAFAPFPLKKFAGSGLAEKKFGSFSEALDAYYSTHLRQSAAEAGTSRLLKEREKLEASLAEQKKSLEELVEEERTARQAGEWIYANYAAVEETLSIASKTMQTKNAEELSKKLGLKIEFSKHWVELSP